MTEDTRKKAFATTDTVFAGLCDMSGLAEELHAEVRDLLGEAQAMLVHLAALGTSKELAAASARCAAGVDGAVLMLSSVVSTLSMATEYAETAWKLLREEKGVEVLP